MVGKSQSTIVYPYLEARVDPGAYTGLEAGTDADTNFSILEADVAGTPVQPADPTDGASRRR
jgi:hypothetical protein